MGVFILIESKTIIAKAILVVLLCTELVVAEKEKPVIKTWTSYSAYSIKAEMSVPRPHDQVYQILIDYESIDEHIDLIKVSRVIERKENIVHLHQVTSLEFLFFMIESETYLVVQEISDKKIIFKKEKGDFKVHKGSWTLIPEEGGQSTLIKYEVQAIPDFYVPKWLVTYFMENEVRKGFEELYLWIMN
jgi:ribosome-associated toxin RatA of RatAB toxin-antitoxin module